MSIEGPVAPHPYDHLPATASFEVTSTDVTDGAPLHDAEVARVAHLGSTSPQVSWSGAPEGTQHSHDPARWPGPSGPDHRA